MRRRERVSRRGQAKWEGRGDPRGERAASRQEEPSAGPQYPPVRLIPRDDARSLWSRGANEPIARFHATGPSTSSRFPDDRRAHAPRPRITVFSRFVRSPSSLSTVGKKNTHAKRSDNARHDAEKTHRCDASGRRRLLTSLLFDLLESCARSSRVRYAWAGEGAIQTEPGALPLTASICLVVSRTALVYKPKK